MTISDVASATETLLSDNWNKSNTDGVTPDIDTIYDVKRMNMMTGTTDTVYVYERDTIMRRMSIGKVDRRKTTAVTIDIRSKTTRAQVILMLAEVDRILKANILSPITGYDIINLGDDQVYQDLSDKRRNLWRFTLEVKMVAVAEAI